MKTEINKGNKLIAQFMGGLFWKSESNNHCFKKAPKQMPIQVDNFLVVEDLFYHSSWEWLMPVIEKIGKDYDVRITWTASAIGVTYIDRPNINDNSIADFGGFGSITNTWKCAVKFIEWYNVKFKIKS